MYLLYFCYLETMPLILCDNNGSNFRLIIIKSCQTSSCMKLTLKTQYLHTHVCNETNINKQINIIINAV